MVHRAVVASLGQRGPGTRNHDVHGWCALVPDLPDRPAQPFDASPSRRQQSRSQLFVLRNFCLPRSPLGCTVNVPGVSRTPHSLRGLCVCRSRCFESHRAGRSTPCCGWNQAGPGIAAQPLRRLMPRVDAPRRGGSLLVGLRGSMSSNITTVRSPRYCTSDNRRSDLVAAFARSTSPNTCAAAPERVRQRVIV